MLNAKFGGENVINDQPISSELILTIILIKCFE